MIAKLLSLKSFALCVAVALATGFASGYYTKSRFAQAARADALVDTRKGDAVAVVSSLKRDLHIQSVLDDQNDFFAANDKAFDSLPSLLEKPIEAPVPTTAPSRAPTRPLSCPGDPVLSDDLIRLLDDDS